MKLFESVDDRGSIVEERLPGYESSEYDNDGNIKKRTDQKRSNDSGGQIALRAFAFFGGGGDGIESDVGEKNDGTAGENTRPAIGREGVIVRGMNESRSEADEHQDSDDLEKHHDVVGFGGFANAADQNHGQKHNDDEGGPVETEMPTRAVEHVAAKVGEPARQVRGGNPSGIGVDAKPVEQIDHMSRETYTNRHVGNGIFENEVPADDPRDEFAHGGVGVRVGAACDGDHCCEFGVTDRSKGADDGHQNKGDGDGGSGTGSTEGLRMIDEVLEKRSVQDRGDFKLLSGNGGADNREDARPDDGADAEGSQAKPTERFFKANFRIFCIGEEFVDALTAKER